MIDYLAEIRRESDTFYATFEAVGTDTDSPVPSCPAWTIADLCWHLGKVHWFWGTVIESRLTSGEEAEAAEAAAPSRPGELGELLYWCQAQTDRMLGLLEATPDDVPVWTWARQEPAHNVGFIRRHQVQEAAVHRWDMQSAATGTPEPLAREAALDAIDEYLAVSLPWCVHSDKPLPGTVHLHSTDATAEVPGEWFVHVDGRVEPIHAKGDVAIRGTASDLLLTLFTRLPVDQLDVIGDAALAKHFTDALNND